MTPVLAQEAWRGIAKGLAVTIMLCLPLPVDVEKGCHLMHVLNCVRLNLRWDLSKAVLQQVLDLLEDQSDIVSTGAHYYTAF